MSRSLVLIALAALATVAACENTPTVPQFTPECARPPAAATTRQGDTITLVANGLRYVERAVGPGDTLLLCILTNTSPPVAGDTLFPLARIDYTLSTLNGRLIESSADRGGAVTFRVGSSGVLPALSPGLIGMRARGIRRLLVPPSLGFGAGGLVTAQGDTVVRPNDTIVLDVTLHSLTDF